MEKVVGDFRTVGVSVTRHPALAAALLSLFTFASCYFRLFIFPHTPLLPEGGNAVGFFVAGNRMTVGELPYRDFFEVLPVGTDLVYKALIQSFGFKIWVPSFVMACLAAGIVMLMTLAASRLVRGLRIVLPGLMLVGFLLLNESLDATHHWFCTLLSIAAMLVLFDAVTLRRVAAAGALGGLAASFTQTTGALLVAGLAVYVAWKAEQEGESRWRQLLLLLGAALVMFVAVNGYFIWAAGLRQWLFCTITFPLRYFTAPSINNWRVFEYDFSSHPSLGRWISFPFLYTAVPLVYVACMVLIKRREGGTRDGRNEGEPWDQLLLVTLTGLAMFLAIAPSPSFPRLASASAPGMILLTWLLERGRKTARVAMTILGASALMIAIVVPIQHQLRWRAYLDLPGGRTAFSDSAVYEEYVWLQGRIHPEQYFFGVPPMYLHFHLRNPAPINSFDTTDYTRPEQVAASLLAFGEHPMPMILVRGWLDNPKPSASDHSGPFRDYVRANYVLVRTFPNRDAVWERNELQK